MKSAGKRQQAKKMIKELVAGTHEAIRSIDMNTILRLKGIK